MLAESDDVDLAQRTPLVRHDEATRLKLAVLDREREVLAGLRRDGTVDVADAQLAAVGQGRGAGVFGHFTAGIATDHRRIVHATERSEAHPATALLHQHRFKARAER